MSVELTLVVSPAIERLQDPSLVKQSSQQSAPAEALTAQRIKDLNVDDDNIKVDTESVDRDLQDEDVSKAISNLNDYAQHMQRQLSFNVDDVTGRTVIQVMDSETEEIVRQIPSEEILAIAREQILREDRNDSDNKGKLFDIQI